MSSDTKEIIGGCLAVGVWLVAGYLFLVISSGAWL